MLRQFKSKFTILISSVIMLTLLLIFSSAMIVQATHSMTVTEVETCLNGAIFDASPSATSALDIEMIGGVYTFDDTTLIAHGDRHTFFEVGETFRFVVAYPADTFAVGDTITVSVSDDEFSLLGGEGALLDVVVADCQIDGGSTDDGNTNTNTSIPNTSLNIDQVLVGANQASFGSVFICADGRLNCQPSALVAVYCDAGDISVYDLTGDNNLPVIQVSEADVDAVGTPDDDLYIDGGDSALGSISLWLLSNGNLSVTSEDFFTGKVYRYEWHGCGN